MKSIKLKFKSKENSKKPNRKVRRVLTLCITAAVVAGTIPSPARADNIEEGLESAILRDVEIHEEVDANEIMSTTTNEESLTIADRMYPTQFVTDNLIETENQAFIVNMSKGSLLTGANLNQKIHVNNILKPMILQTILWNFSLDEVVTISKRAANASSLNVDVFGLNIGDKITIRDLLSIYLLSGAEDAYIALVDYASNNEMQFLSMMNTTASMIGLTQTNFINITGKTQRGQTSSMFDAYSLYRNLMTNEWFMDTVRNEQITITYQNAKNKTVVRTTENTNASWCRKAYVTGDYKYYAQISARSDNNTDGQFVIFTDQEHNYYLSFLGNVNNLRDVGTESIRLIKTLTGAKYYDAEITLTPTPKPTTIPTPKPSPKPTAKPTAKPTPKPTAKPTAKPTQTPKPTTTASKSGLPISSNNARYQYILGTNYKAYTMSNRPTGYRSAQEAAKNMTTFTVPVWKMTSSGGKYSSTMSITIHKKLAKSVKAIFNEIYALDVKFPIKIIVGFSYRKVGGVGLLNSNLMSAHALGTAIDINLGDYDNDYFLGKGNDLRNKSNPYCIPDEVIEIFKSHGWLWGGEFEICADTMHFQYLGLEFLTYENMDHFRKLSYVAGNAMSGSDVKNLQQRLNKLGFSVNISGKYYKSTSDAIKKFQKKYNLTVTGTVDYKTWETIINLTHDMNYVF